MKKSILIPVFVLLLALHVSAQKSTEGSEKSPFGENGPCLVLEIEGQESNVEDVLKGKFKKNKTGKKKGFVSLEEQVVEEVSPNTLDLYYKVEEAGKNNSRIVLFLSTGYDNWMTSATHTQEITNAQSILDGLGREVRIYELNKAIDAQNKLVEDAVKTQEGLEKDLEKLEKEHGDLEEELKKNSQDQEDNKKTQEEQKKTIEEEKKVLDDLQSELGKVGG